MKTVSEEIYESLTDEEKQYYEFLQIHRYKHELCDAFGVSERMVRLTIENMRRKGVPIWSCSQEAGYVIDEDKRQDLSEVYKRRALKMLETCSLLTGKSVNQLILEEE